MSLDRQGKRGGEAKPVLPTMRPNENSNTNDNKKDTSGTKNENLSDNETSNKVRDILNK